MKKFDIIVIGAGPAGLTLAYLLKKANKNVLVVEHKKLYYQNKLCGGLLTKKTYKLLNSIYNNNMEDMKIQKHEYFYIENKDKKIRLDIENYTVHRKLMDNFIIEKFLSIGGTIMDECEFIDLDVDNHRIEINKEKYYFDYLVGADGVFSSVRKNLTDKFQDSNFAYQTHFFSQKRREITISFYNNFNGYGWLIPNHQGAVMGLGEVYGNVKIEKQYNIHKDKLENIKQPTRAAYLPTGNDIMLNYKNIFFIGDAAGLTSPITGGGIYYALLSAKILSKNLNKKYVSKMRPIVRKIKFELFLKKFVYNTRLRNKIFAASDNFFVKKLLYIFAKNIL